MWLLATSTSIDLIHMLEAALICQYCLHVGCRNKKGSGGEGYLNREDVPPGPYYAYIVGARADQHRWVGWLCSWPLRKMVHALACSLQWLSFHPFYRLLLLSGICFMWKVLEVGQPTFIPFLLSFHKFQPLVFLSAEAPSKHIVELAQAEVRNNPRATLGMRKLAAIRLKDAEKGVHKLLKEEGFECTVPVGKFTVRPGFTIPYILLSSWVKYLLDCGRLPKLLVGVPTFAKMRLVLKEWWARFRVLYPDHGYFGHAERHGIPFENLVPFFSHADDGRSYKHLGIWILSSAGCIGRGTRMHVDSNRHRLPLHENAMGANFMGKTWTTQFIFTTVLKTVYTQYPNILDELTSIYAEDMKKLLFEGVLAANGRDRVYLAHMGFKADLPMLQKMGGFHRCWSHVPRQSSSRKPSEGCCHLCLGGREGNPSFPYEDFRPDAAWTATIYMEVPWAPDCPPKIFEGLPLSPTDQMDFKSDFWHNWHLGMSKHFLASALVAIVESDLEILPRGSVEKRFEFLTEMYVKFHRDRNVTPFLAEISRDSMSFPASTAAPVGRWSKALVSTELSLFLDFFCEKHIRGKVTEESHPLLHAIVTRFKVSSI